jgi:paired amphipathic helix protein Sin3a
VYAQVTSLFKAAPDLLEDFKQFLPESAAQAKAAAAAKLASDGDAVPTSNVRGDPNYSQAVPMHGQNAPGPQRLPPVGNFAPPPSASKEKKRRSNAIQTATTTAQSMASQENVVPQGGRIVSGSNVNKVRTDIHD